VDFRGTVFVFRVVVRGPTAVVHDERSVLFAEPRGRRRRRVPPVQNAQRATAATAVLGRVSADDCRQSDVPTVLPAVLSDAPDFGESARARLFPFTHSVANVVGYVISIDDTFGRETPRVEDVARRDKTQTS